MIEYLQPDRTVQSDLKKRLPNSHKSRPLCGPICILPLRSRSSLCCHRESMINRGAGLSRNSSRQYPMQAQILLKHWDWHRRASTFVSNFPQTLFSIQNVSAQMGLQASTAFQAEINSNLNTFPISRAKVRLCNMWAPIKYEFFMNKGVYDKFQTKNRCLSQCQTSSPIFYYNQKKYVKQPNRKLLLPQPKASRFALLDSSRSSYHLPDLLDIQRCGYNTFLQDGIPNLLSQISPIQIQYQNICIELVLNTSNFQLVAPDDNPRDCVFNMTTYSCKLFVEAKIVYKTLSDQILLTTKSEWVLIGHLPIMTKRGHFIINGSPRVVVHQAIRSPGIYFQQVVERDENKILRFYGDIIPRRGVWLRLQTTPRGKIEAKLKKGKKVSAYMLKRCLECLERIETLTLKENRFQDLISTSTTKTNESLSLGKFLPLHLKAWDSPLLKKREVGNCLATLQAFKKNSSSFSIPFFVHPDPITFVHVSEEKALLYAYDKLYRPIEEKERGEIAKRSKNRSVSKNVVVDRRFESKKCYTNLFSTFKDRSRYDLSGLGRQRINSKFGISVSQNQLTAADISAVSNWLEKLSKGKKSVDDIDHFQNRRIRTSGELLYTQFESGIDRLKRFSWNKLKEFVQSNSNAQALTELHATSRITVQANPPFTLHHKENMKTSYVIQDSRVNEFVPKQNHLRGFDPKQKLEQSLGLPFPEKHSFLKGQSKLMLVSIRDFFSTKPLNGALRELFGINPLSQYMDQTNPLAETTHKRRLSSLGIGGVSRESAGMAIRGIHPTHYGRICPIETPEGKNAGLVNSLAFYAKINENGFVETPYYKVVHGQIQHELGFTFFSAKRESTAHLKIAPSDLQKSWNNRLAGDNVPVRVADNILDLFQSISSHQVDCIGISPVQMISVATSLIPFLEHNDANRALMGSNMQRQAVPLMIPERPIVGTGLESLVVAESGHLVQSKATGFISYVSSNKIVVEYLRCSIEANRELDSKPSGPFRSQNTRSKIESKHVFQSQSNINTKILPKPPSAIQSFSSSAYDSFDYFQNKQTHTPYIFSPFVQIDDVLKKSNNGKTHKKRAILLSKGVYTFASTKLGLCAKQKTTASYQKKRRKIEIGKNTSFLSSAKSKTMSTLAKSSSKWNRSEKIRTGIPIQICLHTFVSPEKRHSILSRSRVSSPQWLIPSNSTAKLDSGSIWLNSLHLAKTQQFVPFDHPLHSFDRSNQDTCFIQRALVKEGDWVQKGDILTDCSASDQGQLAVGKNILVAYIPWEGYNFEDAIVISERLVKEDVYTSLHIERYELNAQEIREASEWFTKDLPGVSPEKVSHLDSFGLPQIGSFVQEGDILVGKMRYSNKKPTTAYERLLCDIIGENNFSARDSSLYVPKGVHARVIQHKIVTYFENSLPNQDSGKQSKSPKQVHIFLGEKRAIQIGDKMSGRHGNKGVVATILPRQDMPYLADGTPIDIILNPLGVPSRMNVGQVFEALMGLAGTYLSQHFKLIPFDERYGVEASQSLVYLKLYQARLQSGQSWLFQVDFPGKTRVIDGRSGECFDQWITVGKAYILKLIHMVNEKIHARATGPYALITQQPLRGRSQKGGQRLGEMEVWALEGFGAAYILQELLTKKSDDMVGRKEVASAILPRPISMKDSLEADAKQGTKDRHRFLLGQSEIFKVLMCELQALCLDVGVYSLTAQSFQRSFVSSVHENVSSQTAFQSTT